MFLIGVYQKKKKKKPKQPKCNATKTYRNNSSGRMPTLETFSKLLYLSKGVLYSANCYSQEGSVECYGVLYQSPLSPHLWLLIGGMTRFSPPDSISPGTRKLGE